MILFPHPPSAGVLWLVAAVGRQPCKYGRGEINQHSLFFLPGKSKYCDALSGRDSLFPRCRGPVIFVDFIPNLAEGQ